MFPNDVLDGYGVYTVKLDYTLYRETQLGSKTWSFTTGKGRTIQGLSSQYEEFMLNPGSKLPIEIVASYGEGTYELRKRRLPTLAVPLPV
ncbi:hypothetical protein [Paenibacillus sp. PK1-4R]|uniref:hypothetical protein n=1 Tax=Paenibacillus sp. PK1-4R TaxID=3049075 RepID=UPI0025A0840A|nr:hypothetical protein [Paenibacillus sp. PK1-4R]WJM05889.1 hypothetical protein QNO02_16540 [Paenibacillus sp. PK1-4R]